MQLFECENSRAFVIVKFLVLGVALFVDAPINGNCSKKNGIGSCSNIRRYYFIKFIHHAHEVNISHEGSILILALLLLQGEY